MTEPQQPHLLDRVRDTLRLKPMSLKSEKSYVYYIKEFILFQNKRHPREMGVEEIRASWSILRLLLERGLIE
jgi:hypothetical protein